MCACHVLAELRWRCVPACAVGSASKNAVPWHGIAEQALPLRFGVSQSSQTAACAVLVLHGAQHPELEAMCSASGAFLLS